MTGSRTRRTPSNRRPRAVSRPHDPAEAQADHAADVVARGGSVTGWSFGSVAVDSGVHREEKGPGGEEEKRKKASEAVRKAALESEVGKKLQAELKADPVVGPVLEFFQSTPGKVVLGGAAAAGVAGLAAAKQPLPIQAPAYEFDRFPGLKAELKVEGPVNSPTFVGVSLEYQPQPKGGRGPTEKDRIAADTARLRGLDQMFKPKAQQDQERADEAAAVARYLASQNQRFGRSTLLPLKPGDQPRTVDAPRAEPSSDAEAEKEEPVQRDPVATTEAPGDAAHLDGAVDDAVDTGVRGGGRAMDPATRRSMEARFGYDFSAVRIHDDAGAARAAGQLEANAFTVGEDIVLGTGGDASTPEGRHLLAHELAHVVQQRGRAPGQGPRVHRRSIFESIGILLGLEEGTWSDQELRAYLDAITASGRIDGSYDADNKARAIVRRWKASTPGWDLLGPQKALLIDEMIDGPTLGEDEVCILDLLELSDADDLRVIFADSVARTLSLEDNIHDDNRKRLNAFEESRFQGGRTELLVGRVKVVGDPVPAGAPSYGFSTATFDARLDSDRSPDELITLVDRYSPDDRRKAIDHLLHEVWPQAKDTVGKGNVEIGEAGTDDEKQAVADRLWPSYERVRKSERILQHYFLADVPSSKAELGRVTKAMDPSRAAELKEVLLPRQYTALLEAERKKAAEAKEEPKEPPTTEAAPAKDPKASGAAAPEPVVERTKFHDPDKYRAEIEAALPDVINGKYASTVTAAGKRGTKEEIERMAVVAKRETDAVFAQFYDKAKHPELKFDKPGKPGRLHFWYDAAEVEHQTFGSLVLAKLWLRYYFQSDDTIRGINDKYAADLEFDSNDTPRTDAAKVVVKIVDTATKDKEVVRKLVETRRYWGGMAGGGEVYVDLFHGADAAADQVKCWELFQTLVHEYLHTLANDGYVKYAMSFGGTSAQWNTLIEGIDCVLDEVVWARVAAKTTDPDLRKVVEGESNAKLPPIDVAPPARYPSYDEAFRLVEKVGIQNVYAAYFLGKVDRISVSKEAAAKAAKAAKKTAATKNGGVP